MSEVKLVTAVPAEVAKALSERKRLVNVVNNTPTISPIVLEAIKKYMVDNIGYPNLPVACLSDVESASIDKEDIGKFIPVSGNDIVLLQIEMPEDMVASIPLKTLLDCSEAVDAAEDSYEVDYLLEGLQNDLTIGPGMPGVDVMSFIPFLDFEKCKCWARLNEEFAVAPTSMGKLEMVQLKKLTSFLVD